MFHKIKTDNGKSEKKVYTIASFQLWGYKFLIHVDADPKEVVYCATEKKSGYLALTSIDHDPKEFRENLIDSLIKLYGTYKKSKEMMHERIEKAIRIHGGVSGS